jgi:hypothetical protein
MKKTFGKYAIIDPVKYVFKKEPDWYWMIKAPTAADELNVARILSTDRERVETDGTRTKLLPMTLEIALREVAVTFAGTNIPTSETDATPILSKDATWEEVEEVLKEMPREMLSELWIAVGEAVPGWGPAKRNLPKSDENTKN